MGISQPFRQKAGAGWRAQHTNTQASFAAFGNFFGLHGKGPVGTCYTTQDHTAIMMFNPQGGLYPRERLHGEAIMKNALLLLFAAVYVTSAGAADQAERKVTTDQGRTPVLASLTPQQKRLPSLEADRYKGPNSKFLFYSVTRAGTPNGSVVVENYAVDPQAGDVFTATMECYEGPLCEE